MTGLKKWSTPQGQTRKVERVKVELEVLDVKGE